MKRAVILIADEHHDLEVWYPVLGSVKLIV